MASSGPEMAKSQLVEQTHLPRDKPEVRQVGLYRCCVLQERTNAVA